MFLLAGLGNPGPRHALNRHNIGFMAADEIVRRHGFGPWRLRFQSLVSEGRIDGLKVFCLKPETYMNLSGQAVGEAMRFYKLDPDRLIVLHDDIDLTPGKVRVKRGGGHGGHNGLRSIDSHVGKDYWRVRIGVGHPGDKELVHGHVLRDFAKADMPWVEKLTDALAREIPRLLDGDDAGFMSRVAQTMNPPRPKPPRKPEPEASTEDGGAGKATKAPE
jgi:PTH1 family peptidyl-tRNA hydrolase